MKGLQMLGVETAQSVTKKQSTRVSSLRVTANHHHPLTRTHTRRQTHTTTHHHTIRCCCCGSDLVEVGSCGW